MIAARNGDTVTIARLSSGDLPKRWVKFWRRTPSFFDQQRILKEMGVDLPDRSRVLVSYSVRYRSFAGICGRRVPEDEVNFELVKVRSHWTIEKIWSPIC
jgi:hypothetical protein